MGELVHGPFEDGGRRYLSPNYNPVNPEDFNDRSELIGRVAFLVMFLETETKSEDPVTREFMDRLKLDRDNLRKALTPHEERALQVRIENLKEQED